MIVPLNSQVIIEPYNKFGDVSSYTKRLTVLTLLKNS